MLDSLGDLDDGQFPNAASILKVIKANKKAWENFQKFSGPYVGVWIGFIDAARKRPDEFKKRLRHFVEMTERNKQFDFGGVEKYY